MLPLALLLQGLVGVHIMCMKTKVFLSCSYCTPLFFLKYLVSVVLPLDTLFFQMVPFEGEQREQREQQDQSHEMIALLCSLFPGGEGERSPTSSINVFRNRGTWQ